MKYLVITFVLCASVLAAQIRWSPAPPDPFADGHLAHLPMPPALLAPEPALLPPPKLDHIPRPSPPTQITAGRIEIYDPQASSERLLETKHADQTDWGIPRSLLQAAPLILASVLPPRVVSPVPVNTPARLFDVPVETTSETMEAPKVASAPSLSEQPFEVASAALALPARRTIVLPNLYLPEGATNEEGASLTLISPELHAHQEPDDKSPPSPFVLKSGDRVRPLTRLRNESDYDWIKIERDGGTWWAQAEYFIRVDPRNKLTAQMPNLAIGLESVDKDSALPPDYQPDDLADVPAQFTFGAKDIRLRTEAAEAFARMADEAAKRDLHLRVFSGFRGFEHQKKLYLDAIAKNGPKQNGTAAPGYSEHQLGTTVDVCNADRKTILSGRFSGTAEGRWLHDNANRYGFRNSYTNENTEQVGYKPEPWHLRYIGAPAIPERGIARR